MPAPKKVSVSFRLRRSTKTKQFRCIVQAGNSEIILTGESCKNRKDVKKMVENFIDAILALRYEVIDETKKPLLNNSKLNRSWP